MTKAQILEQLTYLDLAERLAVIEAAVHGIREELAGRPAESERTAKLAAAAAALLADYEAGGELTALTALPPRHALELGDEGRGQSAGPRAAHRADVAG